MQDFETVTVTNVYYFMYRNTTDGAKDINDRSNSFIVSNISQICGTTGFEALREEKAAFKIRNNLESTYMLVSESYVLIMMLCTAFVCCVLLPFSAKERTIPIYLRQAQSNVFLDFLYIRIAGFVFFMILSGCLPQLNFYHMDLCLHTTSNKFGLLWTDYY